MKLTGMWWPKKGSQVQDSNQPGVVAVLTEVLLRG